MIAEYCLVAACAAKGWSDYVNGLWNGSLVQLLEDHVVDLEGIPSLDHTLDLPAFTLLMGVTCAACIRVKVSTIKYHSFLNSNIRATLVSANLNAMLFI